MIKLFKYEGYKITIEPEALLLKPFKKIWDRDKSKNKEKALLDLGFIYFFCDPRSDYQYLIEEDKRKEAIIQGEGLPIDWKVDNEIQEAIEFYCSFKSSSALILEDTRIAMGKVRKFLREVDLTKLDDKGKPIYTINTITSAINQIPTLVKKVDETEKALAKEELVNSRMRGAGEKTIMEDGINI